MKAALTTSKKRMLHIVACMLYSTACILFVCIIGGSYEHYWSIPYILLILFIGDSYKHYWSLHTGACRMVT